MRRLGRTGIDVEERSDTHGSGWVPAADIAAGGGRLPIRLDVPGVRADELGITFDRGVLTISGERGGGYATTPPSTSGNGRTARCTAP